MVIDDGEIVAALRSTGIRSAGAHHALDYWLEDLRASPGLVDLRIGQRSGASARLRIALPSSGRLQPWLYAVPIDAADWVAKLLIWLDEEITTAGLSDHRERVNDNGESYVIAEPYGWRIADRAEHTRVSESAGPNGWNGRIGNDDR
jgi:hypothetical protein